MYVYNIVTELKRKNRRHENLFQKKKKKKKKSARDRGGSNANLQFSWGSLASSSVFRDFVPYRSKRALGDALCLRP
jgi:hypothetical protein